MNNLQMRSACSELDWNVALTTSAQMKGLTHCEIDEQS